MQTLLPRNVFAIVLTLTIAGVARAQAPSPVMEFSSVLTSLDVHHHDGRLQLLDDNAALATAFLPNGTSVDVVITEAESGNRVHVQPMTVSKPISVFNRIGMSGEFESFKFTKPGQYVATYRANGKPMTEVPFTIEFEKNNDQFDPKVHVYASGPWSRYAYLFASVNASEDANPQIRFWVRQKSFLPNPNADRYTVELRRNGDVVAVSAGGSSNSKKWQFMRQSLMHPASKGGRPLKLKEMSDGQYEVLIKRNDLVHAGYRLRIRDGKPMWHPRQASDFQPRTQYIVPRFPGILGTQGDDSAGNMFWMERLSTEDAAAIASSNQSPAADVPDEVRARWEWLPRSIDPNRPLTLARTNVETRNDTGISAGEDLIVFGTGYPTGVKYLRVGDTEAREIPGGETYNANVFGVCGKTIVLVKGTQVVIFDTISEKLTKIPETEISLYAPRSQSFAIDGYLVGTVNRATAVADRTIIKVIDVSGDEPTIMPIKNADYLDSQISSVSIDAKGGMIAVSSQQSKLIAAAKIAPQANQKVFQISDYRGVGPQRIFLEDEWVSYADEDWKVRLLKLSDGTPMAITDEPFPRAGNGFFVRKGRLAVATTSDKVGSRYRFKVGDLDDSPSFVPGTGEPIEGTSGGLGMGGCAAIAVDKTVFIAGTPGDSIGVGEYLQILDDENGKWLPIIGDEGTPIQASDLTVSMGLLAFKTLSPQGKTVIGHATYGQNIRYSPPTPVDANPVMASNDASKGNASKGNASKGKVNFEKENIYVTKDETDDLFLAGLLENESTMIETFTQAFGEDEAKRRVAENMEMVFKSRGKEHLFDEYKRRSTAVADTDRPKRAEPVTSDADPTAVEAVLTGQWRPLRFVGAGEDMPDAAREAVRLTFANGSYILMMGGNIETGTYAIDTSTYPHQITITVGSGKNAGNIRRGSFKLLENDQLLTVFSTNDTDRPARFTSTAENKTLLAGYQRVK